MLRNRLSLDWATNHEHGNAAASRGRLSLARALPDRELTLDPPNATSDEAGAPLRDEDYLILSTIHSAKGQEWKSVFVLNAVDGCIPSDFGTGTTAKIEEERRLLYVAMTRAKDHLHLIVPQRFFTHGRSRGGDRHVFAGRARFIPDTILDRFDCCGWPVVGPAEDRRSPATAGRIDLGQHMRDMWRQGR